MKGLTVLHLIPSVTGGGAERQLALLASGLHHLGVDVHIAAHYAGPGATGQLGRHATLHWLRHSHRSPAVPAELLRVARRSGAHVLHSWLLQMDVVGAAVAFASGLPWVMAERASALAYPRSLRSYLRRRAGMRADLIVANSSVGMALWEGVARGRVAMVPNAVDSASIDTVESTVVGEKPYVLYAGRLVWHKNTGVLSSALHIVLERSDMEVVICGDGPDRAILEQRLAPYIAAGRVHLPGHVEDVYRYMKGAAVFLSASLFEGNPNSVLEAVACGCPVVLSDIPEHREAVAQAVAYFAPAGEARALADAVLQAVADRTASADRRRAAALLLSERTPRRIAQQYIALYEQVITRRRPSRRVQPASKVSNAPL